MFDVLTFLVSIKGRGINSINIIDKEFWYSNIRWKCYYSLKKLRNQYERNEFKMSHNFIISRSYEISTMWDGLLENRGWYDRSILVKFVPQVS